MRKLITSLVLLFVCAYAHAQFPAFPSKMPLGVQTTALGVEAYGSTAPSYNPANVLHDTYLYRDTVLDISWRWSATDEAWQAMGLFFRSSAPPEFQTIGGVTAVYATGFWVDATNDKTHYFDFDLGEWVQFGTAGAADSLAVLQDSIIALYSEGLEIARDTVRFPIGLTAQELSLSPSDTLSISNGNSVFLPYAQALIDTAFAIRSDFPVDTDKQNLSFNIDTLSIERGNSVILPYRQALIDTSAAIRGDFPVNTDNQTLSIAANNLSISGGNTVALPTPDLSGYVTSAVLQDTSIAIRAAFPINTDNQTLSVTGSNLSISGGNTVTLPSPAGDGDGIFDGSGTVPNGTVAETTGSLRLGRNTTFLDVNSTSGNTELSASGSIILTGGSNGIAGKGNFTLSNETGEQARLSLAEDPANGNNTVSVRPPANMASNWTLILPATAGAEDDALTITNVTGSTVTTAWASTGGSGTTELADGVTILGIGTAGDRFRVDTTLLATQSYSDISTQTAIDYADSIFASVGATVDTFYRSGDTLFLLTSQDTFSVLLPPLGLVVCEGLTLAGDTLCVDTSYLATVSFVDSLFAETLSIDSLDFANDTLSLYTSQGVFVTPIVTGGIVSASNGLTETAGNVKLGGALTENTTIEGGEFELSVTSSGVSRSALTATSAGLYGVRATSNAGTAAFFGTTTNATTNTVLLSQYLERSTTGTAADGIGQSLVFACETSADVSFPTNVMTSLWSTANHSSRTSRFILTGVSNGSSNDILTLEGNGQLRLNAYTTNAQIGTGWGKLAVDATGVVVVDTTASSGGGGGNSSTVLGADQTTTSGTFSDVTGLSVPISATGTYWFKFNILFEASIGDPRYDIALNGPTKSAGAWAVSLPGAVAPVVNQSTYNATTATLLTLTGFSTVEGIITFTATGTLIARYKTEVGEPLVIKAGSYVEYRKIN